MEKESERENPCLIRIPLILGKGKKNWRWIKLLKPVFRKRPLIYGREIKIYEYETEAERNLP